MTHGNRMAAWLLQVGEDGRDVLSVAGMRKR